MSINAMEANGDLSTLKLDLTEFRTQAVLTLGVGTTVLQQCASAVCYPTSTASRINAIRLEHHVHLAFWFHSEHTLADSFKHETRNTSDFRKFDTAGKDLFGRPRLKIDSITRHALHLPRMASSKWYSGDCHPLPYHTNYPLIKAVPCKTLSINLA